MTNVKEGHQHDGHILQYFLINEQEGLERNTLQKKTNVVLDFIFANTALLRSFNATPNQSNMNKVYKNYINCTHDSCTVLKLTYDDVTFLLTADASKKVFNRLINQNKFALRADYLKMPHHGSKNNMTAKILSAILPKVAIISHNNGLFGQSADPHPNKEVISLLLNRGIDILVTNDVIKNNSVIIAKRNNKPDRYVNII